MATALVEQKEWTALWATAVGRLMLGIRLSPQRSWIPRREIFAFGAYKPFVADRVKHSTYLRHGVIRYFQL